MCNIDYAFEIYKGNTNNLVGYQKIGTRVIFDIKLGDNFRINTRLVAARHKTKTMISITYISVVSRESIMICLLLEDLNDLGIQEADIENVYLIAH